MSNWLFKHDLNAETISQFGYVWVKLRSKYLEFLCKMKSWVYIKSRRQTGYV